MRTAAPERAWRISPPGKNLIKRITETPSKTIAAFLPETAIVLVTGTDPDGDAIARPVGWDGDGPARRPSSSWPPEPRGQPALAPGERVLARLKPTGAGPLRRPHHPARSPTRPAACSAFTGNGRIVPTDRRAKAEWVVPPGEDGGAEDGEIVLAEPLPAPRARPEAGPRHRAAGRDGRRPLGQPDLHPHPRHPARLPAPRRCAEADARRAPCRSAGAPTCATSRWSPSTARTRATSTTRCSPSRMATASACIVAIADVAHYVRPGSRARPRGPHPRQQRLFPRPRRADAARGAVQRLVQPAPGRGPRLPVRRDADRRAAAGRPAHRFGRGLMRSAARLTYEQVQTPMTPARPDGRPAASLRRVPRPAGRPHRARHARPRPAGAPGGAGRRRRGAQRRAAPAARQPPADRGVHGAANVAAAEELERLPPALHVPGPRAAVGREAGGAARLPARPRHLACRRATRCIRATSTACCDGSPARRRRRWSTR